MGFYLSKYQAEEILKAHWRGGDGVDVSLDLGITKSRVRFDGESVILPDGQRIRLDIIRKVSSDLTCCLIEGGEVLKMQFFLKETGKFYRLISSGLASPPTAEISGIRMHRMKGRNPRTDTLDKVRSIAPLGGRVLDTCCGLGYTAIESLNAGASEVYTVEVDPGMVHLRESNPWSDKLSDERIVKVAGDVFDVVKGYPDGFFNSIIHDPPMLSIAGVLYSRDFYRQLLRVLVPGGRLFHYVGAPGSRYRGKNPALGVMNRLMDSGFTQVEEKSEALGVVAVK